MNIGKVGEEYFIQFCHDNSIKVVDLRDIEQYQKIDCDFACKYKERIKLVEVKSDSNMGKTGNFCLEFYQHLAPRYEDSELGWAFTSKAELLCIYDVVNEKLYIFYLNDLLIFSVLYQSDYRRIKKIDRMTSGKTKTRELLLVKIEDFVEWTKKHNKPLLVKESGNDDNI